MTLKITASPNKNKPYTAIIFNPQKTRLFTNVLSDASWFHSFKLLKALNEPMQLEKRQTGHCYTSDKFFYNT